MKDLFNVEQLTQFEFGAIILTVLIAGLVFGCLIAWGLLNRKSNPRAVAAEKIKQEFEEYKEKVDEHFDKTSEMFKDVTTQYKKLYDHMSVGAIELGNADTITTMPRLEMQDSEDKSEMEQDQEITEQQSSDIEETQKTETATESSQEQVTDNVEQTNEDSAKDSNQEHKQT